MVLPLTNFPLRVILLSPSGNIFSSDLIRFAFNFFDIFFAKSSEEFPAITLINKQTCSKGILKF
jgi:hypothetical protein